MAGANSTATLLATLLSPAEAFCVCVSPAGTLSSSTPTHCALLPPCQPLCRDLRTKFLAKAGEFMAALADAHRTAHSERSDTREELESLLNLMSRLDFNGYFSAQPRPAARPAPAAGLASGGGDRMTVRFGAAA